MRILVVNWQDRENPQSGGAETHLHEIFGRIAGMGHEVVLLCSGFDGARPAVELDGIEVHRTGRRYTFGLHARGYFRRHLAPRGFDVIVEDLNKVPLFTPRWSATPVVLLVHHLFGRTAFEEASFPVALATWLLERPVPRAFRGLPVIAISESTRADLVSRGMDAARIRIVPNGVDVEFYSPAAASQSGGRRYDEPTLLYLGRIKRYKRVDLPLRALAALRDQGFHARFLVAGKGDAEEELRALRAELGLEDRVELLGFVDDERKLELFRRTWVHVLTSPKEGWGISNLEAAGCETPTVASDAPGLRESVLHGETGYLVPHGDVEALAARLRELLEDPALRARMGERARAFALGFSWDASARRILEVLREAAGERPRPGVGAGPGGQ